jgi:hypothetical protein
VLRQFSTDTGYRLLRFTTIATLALTLAALAGCSTDSPDAGTPPGGEPPSKIEELVSWAGFSTKSQGEQAVDKLRALADAKCHEGNQAACDTIIQIVGDRVAIESVGGIDVLTHSCNAGKQEVCQQLGVLHAELSDWCSTGNARACATVNVGPWPKKLDIPASVDSAKLACQGGQLKPDSQTCRALANF